MQNFRLTPRQPLHLDLPTSSAVSSGFNTEFSLITPLWNLFRFSAFGLKAETSAAGCRTGQGGTLLHLSNSSWTQPSPFSLHWPHCHIRPLWSLTCLVTTSQDTLLPHRAYSVYFSSASSHIPPLKKPVFSPVGFLDSTDYATLTLAMYFPRKCLFTWKLSIFSVTIAYSLLQKKTYNNEFLFMSASLCPYFC